MSNFLTGLDTNKQSNILPLNVTNMLQTNTQEAKQKIKLAKDISEKLGKPQVIILMVDQEIGILEFVSYGKTKKLCVDAQILGDVVFDAVDRYLRCK